MIRVYCDRCNALIDTSMILEHNIELSIELPVLDYDNKGILYISGKLCLCYDCLTQYIDYCNGREVKEVQKLKTIIE